jgi:hypothetical protein
MAKVASSRRLSLEYWGSPPPAVTCTGQPRSTCFERRYCSRQNPPAGHPLVVAFWDGAGDAPGS